MNRNILKSFIKAVITSAALTMDYDLIADDISTFGYADAEALPGTLSKLLYAIEAPSITALLLIVFFTFMYLYLYDKRAEGDVWLCRSTALFAAFCAITGKLFYVYDDIWLFFRGTVQLAKGLFVLVGLFWLFSGLAQLAFGAYISYCDKGRDERLGTMIGKLFVKRHSGIFIAALILTAWIPTIAAYYPAVFMGDSEDIIYMAYNYPSGLEDTVLPLREGLYVTNHHPVVYTLYVSIILHTVRMLGGSWNFGIFWCAMIQCLLTLGVLAYSCRYCAKYLKNEQLALAAVLFYALFPLMPKYAIMISKDTFFADLLLLWAILIHKTVNTKEIKKDMTALIAVSAGIALIRKNGIYVIILTLIFAIILYKNHWKRWILAMACILAVSVLHSNAVLPSAGIPEGSIAEMLSIPFQQTARYVKYHGDEVTEAEKHAISGVLDYDTLAENYSGNLSDPVKRTYNKSAAGAQRKAYFAAWFKMLLKHPEEYVAAFLNNYYGYFYPVVNDAMKLARTSVGSMANVNRDGYFDYSHCYDGFHVKLRDLLTFYDLLWMRIPVLNLLMTSALYVWAAAAAFLFKCVRRDKAAILPAVMYLALMLTVLAGPSNAINYERYVFPCILGMPLLITLTFCENERSTKNG